jgi:hypothetical protein
MEMKRMKKQEIKAKAESLATNAICCHGIKNAKDILYEAYKIVRDTADGKK